MKTESKNKPMRTNWWMRLSTKHHLTCVFLLAPAANTDGCCDDGCWINEVCHEDGDVNPDNRCEVCDAAANPAGWTTKPAGAECDYCLHCDDAGSCVEQDIDCCSTQGVLNGDCADSPNILVREGCIFSHQRTIETPSYLEESGISAICTSAGTFDYHSHWHNQPEPCDACIFQFGDVWKTSSCDLIMETDCVWCSD